MLAPEASRPARKHSIELTRSHARSRPRSRCISRSTDRNRDGDPTRRLQAPALQREALRPAGKKSGEARCRQAVPRPRRTPQFRAASAGEGGGREGRLRSGTRQGEKVVVGGGCIGREVESSRGRVDYCGRGGGRRGSGRRALAGRDAGVGERGWGAARARCAPSSERASVCACASNDGPVEGERGSGPWSGKRVTRTATRRRGRGRRTRFLRHLSRILHARKRKRERTGQRMLLMSDEGCGSARFAELVEAERAARCRAGSGGCSRVRARAG